MNYLSQVIKKLIYRFRQFNRRTHSRIDLSSYLPCTCFYNTATTTTKCQSFIINISQSGTLLMIRKEKILPEQPVEMRVQIPSRKEEISIQGEVVRTYRRSSREWYYSGVKFRNPDDNNIDALIEYISKEYAIPKRGIKETW